MTDFKFWPETQHEAISDEQAAVVREVMETSAPWLINTPRPDGVAKEGDAPSFLNVDDDILTLTVRKVWMPAPWTEYPYIYVWKVALSNDWETWVAGAAEARPTSYV